jgi:hypothetical protein
VSREAEYLIWQRSRAGKTDLLMLLTIGNGASVDGRDAFSEVPYLMDRCRLSERGAEYTLQRLVEQGEIEIEYNTEGREIPMKGGRLLRPKWFIHVLCVCEWERYQTGWKPATVASFKTGRPRRKPAKIAGSQVVENPQLTTRKPAILAEKPATSDVAYKERAFSELVIELKQGADAPDKQAAAPPTATTPDENVGVITVLAHGLLDILGLPKDHELGEYADALKDRCAEQKILYDGTVVRKALDSAIWQRRQKRQAR